MKTVRIFISSPGDVDAERILAREIIADLQKRYVGSLLLQPVLWEEIPLGSDVSFQEGIDVVLSAEGGIDVAIFILWSRMGSPTGKRIRKTDGTEYLSGTEREWDLMLRAREASGVRPKVLTYIRRDENSFVKAQFGKELSVLRDMVDQHLKVRAFIAEHFTEEATGTNVRASFSYEEPITFAHLLRTHLRAWLDQQLVDTDLAAAVWHPAEQGSPFRGLEVFEYEHAPLFFGREQEVCDIQIRLRQRAEAGCAFVLLVGASGSGKSSLARAGVAPAVAQYDREDEAAEWRRAVFTPGVHRDDLLLGLVRALAAPHALPELAEENLADLADGLARDPELTFRFKLRPLLTGRRRLLLIFDQVEELFTHGETMVEAHQKFGAALGVLARSRAVWVLATIRSDYYARFQEVPELLALKGEGAHIDLPPPAVAELQHIITQPARAAGLRFEENGRGERLDARLLTDAAEHPEALPLLEYFLDALYQCQAARGDGLLSWADYEAMRTVANRNEESDSPVTAASEKAESGLAGAVVSQAEAAFASLPSEHQRQCLSAIFSKLLDLSSVQQHETPIRRTALETELLSNPYRRGKNRQPEELPGARAFLQAFSSRRLLVPGTAAKTAHISGEKPPRTYMVAHEALLRNWWRLRRLQATYAEFFRIRLQIERARADWQAAKRNDSLLLATGLPVQLAGKLAAEAPELLTDDVADYIARSAARVERLQWRRRLLAAAVFTGLAVLAWFGFSGKEEAQRQTGVARERAGEARRQAGIAKAKTEIATAKTEEAEARTAEARAQVHQALISDLATARNLLGKGSWREGLMYLRRAQRYDDSSNWLAGAWLWNEVVYGQGDRDSLPQFLLHHKHEVFGAVYSPDGTRILTASADNTARQWDAATGRPLGELRQGEGYVYSAAYSRDGTRIVIGSMDNLAQQWDAATGKPIGDPLRHPDQVRIAAYSPDGKRIVTADIYNVQQWDAASGKPIGKPLHQGGVVESIDYSPDGTRIVTASSDKPVRQWAAASGQPIGEPLRCEAGFSRAVYSPDGKRILTVCYDRTARQWDAATGKPIGKPLPHEDHIESAAYSPDGTRIVTASWDKTARQWDVATSQQIGEILRHDGWVSSAVYSPDGTHIVTASKDSTVRQWEAATGKPAGVPLRFGEEVRTLAYNSNSTRVVAASTDGTIRQWNTVVDKPIGEPIHEEGRVNSVAYNPDATRIVTTSDNKTARQWDAVTGKPIGETLYHEDKVRGAVYRPDGARIVTICGDYEKAGYAQQWDAASSKPIGEPMRHKERIESVAYSPDGTRLVTGCWDGVARQWDAATGKLLGKPLSLDVGEGFNVPKMIGGAAYSPDGTRIVVGYSDGAAWQWDSATGRQLGEAMWHHDLEERRLAALMNGVESGVYSYDGLRIVTVAFGAAWQWEAATGKPLGEPLRSASSVSSAAFSPDGTRIIAVCSDNTSRQWDCSPHAASPPAWMDDFVQTLAGLRFDDNGELVSLTIDERLGLRARVQAHLDAEHSSSNSWEQLARWTLTARSQRQYTPGGALSTMEIAKRDLDSEKQANVEAALHFVPDLPLAHRARRLSGLRGSCRFPTTVRTPAPPCRRRHPPARRGDVASPEAGRTRPQNCSRTRRPGA